MAAKIHGRLGSATVTGGNTGTIYTVPASRKATVTINAQNQHAGANTTTISIGTGGSPVAADAIAVSALAQDAALTRTGITLQAGMKVFVAPATGNAAANVWGVEEDA